MSSQVTIHAESSNAPIEYSLWDGETVIHDWQQSNIFTGVDAGKYLAKCRDAEDCQAEFEVDVPPDAPQNFDVTVEEVYQYDEDFSSYSIGSPPSDWTKLSTEGTFNIEGYSGSNNGKTLSAESGYTSEPGMIVPNSIPVMEDMEVEARVFVNSYFYIGLRIQNNSPWSGYYIEAVNAASEDQLQLWIATDNQGDYQERAWLDSDVIGSGSWVQIKAQIVGNNIKAKMWADGDSEPTSWILNSVVSGYNSGIIGFGGSGNNKLYVDSFNITEL